MKSIKFLIPFIAALFLFTTQGFSQATVLHNVGVFVSGACGGVTAHKTHLTIRPDGSATLILKYKVDKDCVDGDAYVGETICFVGGVRSLPGHVVVTNSGNRNVSCQFEKGALSHLLGIGGWGIE